MALAATFAVVHPASEPASEILFRYYADVVGRFHGREASDDEVLRAMIDEPSDDLTGNSGLLVVAYVGVDVVGCGGIRFVSDDTAELTRLFVDASARGSGVGVSIVEFLEGFVQQSNRTKIRLDTRADLVEARRLYSKLGYREVPAFNAEPYAEVWLEKRLY
ncbi:GNAT family N-acetyltransferase [Rhodococcus sp. SBT000017]|mgnify:CR=1 FL=1|uniref:GNAT family N-acetyltransferase n=1 Tax=unclassified Rhodococcus (in: high G+C Gram-positive bacteria) TaxID=192944 RepID=UPI000B0DC913|nr:MULTISPECIES: GNAT family N-acetyltransferase [unclassified Rhodococcus (in: high G+C Gram-positive bacteria)]RMB77771.1 GNAT family N-acetyltransferase [Rhodococcus sp. SBT000017]